MHFLFAWRYFRAKKSTNVINIIAWICITAIVVGTAALILVLSVFNGFEGLVKSLYSSFYPDIRVGATSGKVITITPEQLQKLKNLSGVRNFSLVAEEKGILQADENQSLVHIKGVDENYKTINSVAQHVDDGEYNVGTVQHPKIILGAGVEAVLGVRASLSILPLTIYVPRHSGEEQIDPLRDIASDTIHTSGAFVIQQDFDNKYAITNLQFLKASMQLGADEYTAVEIAVNNPAKTDKVKAAIQQLFGSNYKVENRYEQNQTLYSVMNMERWVFYAILCLILVVAAFNMVGALTMLVLEKQKDISILNALGANRRFILRVFLNEGFLLAIIGGVIGMLLALVMVLVQQKFHIVPLQGGSFLIDYFPVTLRLSDFLLVAGTVIVIAFIASFVPAFKASKQQFSLRSE
ncbi:MAG: FtsX-like permease family protein [Niabella sp.]